jgi:hypothetical protein
MKFLVFDSMMPDEPPLLSGDCDEEQMILQLSGRRGDSWTSTVRRAIAQRGAPSDLRGLVRLNSRFQVVLTDDSPGDDVEHDELIGGSSGVIPGQAPTAPNAQAEILEAIGKNGRSERRNRSATSPGPRSSRRERSMRARRERSERESE